MTVLYQLKKVSFSYSQNKILENLDLEIEKGSFVGVLGANGSGKTTLLRLLSAYLKNQKGEILLEGKEIHHLSARKRALKIAVVPQQFDIAFPFSVEEVVLMGRWAHLKAMAWASKEDVEIARECMELTDCLYLKDRLVNELSGGEKERVLLARALAQGTEILLLDEPTTHLDLKHQVEIFQLLKKLHQEKKFTLVTVLHDLNFAAQACEKVLLLHQGGVKAFGKPSEIFTPKILEEVFNIPIELSSDSSKTFYLPRMNS